MRRVSHHMGMPISIDIPECVSEDIFTAYWEILSDIDTQFSPYKPNSEVSQIASGKKQFTAASSELKTICKQAEAFEKQTAGYFSVFYNGRFDPSGIVKAWAIQKVAEAIQAHGYATYYINAGGDILCNSKEENYWNMGIANPDNPDAYIGVIHADATAVATSGSYQKGKHIYNPITKTPAHTLKSVTVIGPDILSTDVYATALYAMGYKALQFAHTLGPRYKTILIDANNYSCTI